MTNAANDTSTPGMRALIDLRSRLAKLTAARMHLTKVEEEVRASLDEVRRKLMSVAFATADIDDQEIHVDGVLHGKVDRRPGTIHTSFGPSKSRACTVAVAAIPSWCRWKSCLGSSSVAVTPKLAKVLLHLTA